MPTVILTDHTQPSQPNERDVEYLALPTHLETNDPRMPAGWNDVEPWSMAAYDEEGRCELVVCHQEMTCQALHRYAANKFPAMLAAVRARGRRLENATEGGLAQGANISAKAASDGAEIRKLFDELTDRESESAMTATEAIQVIAQRRNRSIKTVRRHLKKK